MLQRHFQSGDLAVNSLADYGQNVTRMKISRTKFVRSGTFGMFMGIKRNKNLELMPKCFKKVLSRCMNPWTIAPPQHELRQNFLHSLTMMFFSYLQRFATIIYISIYLSQTNLPMFFILIFASGGISSGSLYKDRWKDFTSMGNANLITSSCLCMREVTHIVIIENRCRFFGG